MVRQAGASGEDHRRPGWADMPAIRSGRIFEVKSPYILQPGPAALTEGVAQSIASSPGSSPRWPPDDPLLCGGRIDRIARAVAGDVHDDRLAACLREVASPAGSV